MYPVVAGGLAALIGPPIKYVASTLGSVASKAVSSCMRSCKKAEHAVLARPDQVGAVARTTKAALMTLPAASEAVIASWAPLARNTIFGLIEGARASSGYMPGWTAKVDFLEDGNFALTLVNDADGVVKSIIGNVSKLGIRLISWPSEILAEIEDDRIVRGGANHVKHGGIHHLGGEEIGGLLATASPANLGMAVTAMHSLSDIGAGLIPNDPNLLLVAQGIQRGVIRGSLVLIADSCAGPVAGVATAFACGVVSKTAIVWSKIWNDPHLQASYAYNKDLVVRRVVERETLSQLNSSEGQPVFTDPPLTITDAYLH